MKGKNKLIIVLVIIGLISFFIVQFYIVPNKNAKHEKYLKQQLGPTTQDLNNILKYKNDYMGNASNIINLFYNLPLADIDKSFELFSDKFTLEVNYKDTVSSIGEEKVKKALIYNSTAAFALIGNLQHINYYFTGKSYKIDRSSIEKLYDEFNKLLNKENWKAKVQNKLNDEEYVSKSLKLLLKDYK